MRPKLKYQPINAITNTSADIPSNAIGYIVEVYHNDGTDRLGRISYNNSSRSIDFNKKKTGGSGHGYYPKYTQQIFLTKDQNNILPTRLTAYSNGGHVSIKGWLILEKVSREPALYFFEPSIEKALYSNFSAKYYDINETLIFSSYNGFVKLPVKKIISSNNNLSILVIDSYNYLSESMVFYLSTTKSFIVGKLLTIKDIEGEHLFLVCKSKVEKPFLADEGLLSITTHYAEISTDVKIEINDKIDDVYKLFDDNKDLDLLLENLDLRLENFHKAKGGSDIVSGI